VIGNNNSLANGRPTRSAIQAINPSEAGVPRSGTLTQRSASERLGLTISEII
jgi:hypothetical protein